jgi:hypothetical protein
MNPTLELICSNCHVALLEPHQNPQLYRLGWFKCRLCAFSKIIEREKIENRIKNQK